MEIGYFNRPGEEEETDGGWMYGGNESISYLAPDEIPAELGPLVEERLANVVEQIKEAEGKAPTIRRVAIVDSAGPGDNHEEWVGESLVPIEEGEIVAYQLPSTPRIGVSYRGFEDRDHCMWFRLTDDQ